ncbi:hypothetical protein LMG31884_13840 [Xanthomonas hydrangeae]|nr:hypothetical protein LMG31884_13840 [Xanthomonas hydrangeae]CAD7714951.1 hypothetical protein LMG31884_13840 [Xanthomonas hydrangeae]
MWDRNSSEVGSSWTHDLSEYRRLREAQQAATPNALLGEQSHESLGQLAGLQVREERRSRRQKAHQEMSLAPQTVLLAGMPGTPMMDPFHGAGHDHMDIRCFDAPPPLVSHEHPAFPDSTTEQVAHHAPSLQEPPLRRSWIHRLRPCRSARAASSHGPETRSGK